MSKILISTGGLDHDTDYEIIDAIFAIGSTTEKFFSGINANDAFEGVKNELRKKCEALGGQAVIDCSFEYRVAVAQGAFGGTKQVIELFGYGTAVRLG
ncbi:MAG: hypothetical protein ACI32B_09045 [Erysipelotrichaceae bacterium]